MRNLLNEYAEEHSSLPSEALEWLERQTNIHTNFPRMLSGRIQGELLRLLVKISGARKVLEIGTFTGYSTICLASGLPEDGHVDTLEINDELVDLIYEGWRKAGLVDRISLHTGDAAETLIKLSKKEAAEYDLVFIDADKREYCKYYELVIPMLRKGGILIADDVLWDGKVCADPLPCDSQTRGLLEFNDILAEDPRMETVMLPFRDGISVALKLH